MCGLIAAIEDVWTQPPRQAHAAASRGSATPPIPILTDTRVLHRASALLQHRGPDGTHVRQGVIGNGGGGGTAAPNNGAASPAAAVRWAMGHTRLAIVDPHSRLADMPFTLTFQTNNSRKYKIIHLAANGEIYNHEQLYAQLVIDGWTEDRRSLSDCEVIAHAYAHYGGPRTAALLDGMFAFVIFEQDVSTGRVAAFAARDPVGIKPLYYGRTRSTDNNEQGVGDAASAAAAYVFSSELKALVGHVDASTVVAMPPGHYWSPDTGPDTGQNCTDAGLVCYYNPEWLRKDHYAPWENDPTHTVTKDQIRYAFTKAVQKRMMADVEYGFFLSGGVDSCIVAHDLLPLWRNERCSVGDDRPIPTYTVGMENSPDVMAARAMVDALGGAKYVDHHIRLFTPDEVFDLIPKIIYHMESYEAELIRSSIPNWLLAERAAWDVRMVITGEGADELFAGYLYFQDASTPTQVQNELRRIYNMLGNVNLHRTDRMTMAHGLEARVPFLDTEFTRLVMSIDPTHKMVHREAVINNARGREKTYLRELYEGPNANGHTIPTPILWRAKAMQCEGVGEDWVSILQRRVSGLVSDAELSEAHILYPVDTPQTKEELYYRRIFDEHYHGMEHVVKLWKGGGRAMGAEWKSDMYTREGLKNVNLLSHSLQQARSFSSTTTTTTATTSTRGSSRRGLATMPLYELDDEPYTAAIDAGYDAFEACLTCGGDDRSLILETGTNKYHIRPRPIDPAHVFRGSCTGNPPTVRGYQAAKTLFHSLPGLDDNSLDIYLGPVIEDQRTRLFHILNLPDGAEIIFCPSGSDAEYIPIVIARALNGDLPISNGVVQVREIGAGSAPAACGKYFSTHAPLIGRISDDAKTLDGFEGVEGVEIVARDRCGTAVDASREMDDFIHHSLSKGSFPIVHGVFGGKTGLRDSKMPGSMQAGAKSLGVVDACQGRFTQDEIKEWLDQDSLVLFTASKFYQAPPFCGAVVIPPRIAQKLRNASVPANKNMLSIDGLGGFMTGRELPKCMEHWKSYLPKDGFNNLGLVLRWEAGMAGMEALAHIPDEVRTVAVNEWAGHVSTMVNNEPMLDAWCVERSIVSIRVANGRGDRWLSMSELRDLYRWMSMDVASLVKDATMEEKEVLSKHAYIGQPVDVSETHAIVRIALGVDSLLCYLNNKDSTLQEDHIAVKKLAAIARYFETLKKSGK